MKFNSNKAKNSATGTVAVVGGFLAGHTVLDLVTDKLPESVRPYAPFGLAALAVAAPGFLSIKSDMASNALTGLALTGTIKGLNAISKDETGAVATTGYKATIAKFVPQISGLGSVDALPFLPVYEYGEDAAHSLMQAGSSYAALPAAPQQSLIQNLL